MTLPPYTPPPPKDERGPFFWVALGCGGCAGGLVVFVFAVVALVMVVIRHSTPVRETVQMANEDARVAAALGTPVKPGYLFIGNISSDDHEGAVDLRFDIEGPRGGARMIVAGRKIDGEWAYSRITVKPEDGGAVIEVVSLPEPTSTDSPGG